MLKFFGKTVGEAIDGKSYFASIKFNNKVVKNLSANGNVVAVGQHTPILEELKAKGCVKASAVYASYPYIEQVISGNGYLEFDGASCFQLENIPEHSDTVEARFMLQEVTSNAKTLFCSRTNSTNSFSTFIINNYTRSDFGSTMGTSKFILTNNVFYTFTQKAGEISLNGSVLSNSSEEFTPSVKFSIGASTTGNNTSFSNYLSSTLYNTFAIIGEDGMYKCYLIPVETNKMADLVSGKIYENLGTGTAEFILNVNLTSVDAEDDNFIEMI